jgi:hypothetical protein
MPLLADASFFCGARAGRAAWGIASWREARCRNAARGEGGAANSSRRPSQSGSPSRSFPDTSVPEFIRAAGNDWISSALRSSRAEAGEFVAAVILQPGGRAGQATALSRAIREMATWLALYQSQRPHAERRKR